MRLVTGRILAARVTERTPAVRVTERAFAGTGGSIPRRPRTSRTNRSVVRLRTDREPTDRGPPSRWTVQSSNRPSDAGFRNYRWKYESVSETSETATFNAEDAENSSVAYP